ncbi:MAG: hypothetical protein HYW88_00575 [Candidatus Sungbacteria bacterium]|nr:hypothetical protein [Candidatus Sungbacteria bacterium]
MPTESNNYRDQLAAELKAAPKEMRQAVLKEAIQSGEYIEAFLEHNRPKWEQRDKKRQESLEARKPELVFNLEDEKQFERSIDVLAQYVYSTMTGTYEGGYDPYKGHMLCGEITDKFIAYLKSKGIQPKKISRTYEIKAPNGEYNDSFGHVYLIIDEEEKHILVDPTWMQWLSPEEMQKQKSPVLIIRFKDFEDLKSKFKEVPIKNGMVLPFYLGFDSDEAKEYFKNSNYTTLSADVARIDN